MERGGTKVFSTSFGWVGVTATVKGIVQIVLPKKTKRQVEMEIRTAKCGKRSVESAQAADARLLNNAVKLLQCYFSGKPVSFGLPLDLRYSTAFQQAVWKAAASIPRGETRSYAWIAKRIKRPKAVRAVGQALGANPVALLIPCHRVISSAGTLGGFSGGLGLKKKLLDLEAHAKDRCRDTEGQN